MGLLKSGVCPECGTSVEQSLAGDLLRFSSPRYLRTLHAGTALVLAGLTANVLSVLIGIVTAAVRSAAATRDPASSPAYLACLGAAVLTGAASMLLSPIGWWLLSARDPGLLSRDEGVSSRRMVRISVLAHAACAGAALPYAEWPAFRIAIATIDPTGALAFAVGVSRLIAFLVWFFASMQYIARLARRVPDPALCKQATAFAWLGPLLSVVGACVLFLGPIVAMILYVVLLVRVRVALRAALLSAENTGRINS